MLRWNRFGMFTGFIDPRVAKLDLPNVNRQFILKTQAVVEVLEI
jgi:hypothetical protein